MYATHGFSAAEVLALVRKTQGQVTPVFSTELLVSSGDKGFPLIPVDTMLANPSAFASAASVPALAAAMSRGLVLATEEATLRQVRTGDRVQLSNGRSLPVTAVVDAHEIGGHEMATSTHVITPHAGAAAAYVLVGGSMSSSRLLALTRAVWPTRRVRVRDHTVNGYLSGADTVLTQLQMKLAFGEFSERPAGTGAFAQDSSWTSARLRTRRIEQLGDVTCNVAIMGPLAAAMHDITAAGLGSLIDTADFAYQGGCWNPRVSRAVSTDTLSSHSWGIAVDINVARNPLGAPPRQDPRLVAIMAAHGFAWGGRFLRPDGAHFQYVGSLPH